MSGQGIAAEIAAAVAEATAEVGIGSPLIGTITRKGPADRSTYPPTPGAPKDYTFAAMMDSFSVADHMATEISARDVKVLVTRPVRASDGEEIEPGNGDTLTVAGQTYSIVNVEATAQGGYAMMWECQCRSAG